MFKDAAKMKLKESLEDGIIDEKMTNISQNIPDSALKKPAVTGIDCGNILIVSSA